MVIYTLSRLNRMECFLHFLKISLSFLFEVIFKLVSVIFSGILQFQYWLKQSDTGI